MGEEFNKYEAIEALQIVHDLDVAIDYYKNIISKNKNKDDINLTDECVEIANKLCLRTLTFIRYGIDIEEEE